MQTASPTTSVLDEVTTWPGISTQPTPSSLPLYGGFPPQENGASASLLARARGRQRRANFRGKGHPVEPDSPAGCQPSCSRVRFGSALTTRS